MMTLQPLAYVSKVQSSKLNNLAVSVAAACLAPVLTMSAAQAADKAAANTQLLMIEKFAQCANLNLGAARLACYDKVMNGFSADRNFFQITLL